MLGLWAISSLRVQDGYRILYNVPRRSKYPIFKVSGPKNLSLVMVFGTKVLQYRVLGPWGKDSIT